MYNEANTSYIVTLSLCHKAIHLSTRKTDYFFGIC